MGPHCIPWETSCVEHVMSSDQRWHLLGVAPTGAFVNVPLVAVTHRWCGNRATLHDSFMVSSPECVCAVATAVVVAIAPTMAVSSGATFGGIKGGIVDTSATFEFAWTNVVGELQKCSLNMCPKLVHLRVRVATKEV